LATGFGDAILIGWVVERIVHFGPGDLVRDGLSHFGFHDRVGNHYAIFHQRHFLGLVGEHDRLEWTVAARRVSDGTRNIVAELNYPIYIDNLADGTLGSRILVMLVFFALMLRGIFITIYRAI